MESNDLASQSQPVLPEGIGEVSDTGWQPIATAPKDAPILVWDGSHVSIAEWTYAFRPASEHWRQQLGATYNGQPLDDVGDWWALAGGCSVEDGGYDHNLLKLSALQWMPLPAAPSS